jgi:hypothetical protein
MPLVLERLGAQVVVRMLGLIDGFASDAILLARPGAEVDHLASLGAKRPKAIGRRHIDGLLADRASHRKEKLPKLRAPRNDIPCRPGTALTQDRGTTVPRAAFHADEALL